MNAGRGGNWYYADRNRQTHGPMQAQALAQRVRDGHIGLDAPTSPNGSVANWAR
ncbi:GYF domain-containing protein [Pseudoxanthomonas spadix]